MKAQWKLECVGGVEVHSGVTEENKAMGWNCSVLARFFDFVVKYFVLKPLRKTVLGSK